MKALFRLITLSFVVMGLLINSMLAQGRSRRQSSSDEVRARAIRFDYDNDKVDGMLVKVYKVAGEGLTPVKASDVFREGDKLKLEFESNFDGNVYIINIEPSGKKVVIYPTSRNASNTVRARQSQSLPLHFTDNVRGIEVLQVIMSRQPIQVFDEAIKNYNGELGATAAGAASELSKTGGVVTENVAVAVPEDQMGGIRPRGVKLVIGKEKDKSESALVAIPEQKGKDGKTVSGKLGKDDYAVFEVRLQHEPRP